MGKILVTINDEIHKKIKHDMVDRNIDMSTAVNEILKTHYNN